MFVLGINKMHVRLTKVVLTNFKSYYGRVEVDIDGSFIWYEMELDFHNSIVGKNGSGKSAFMDALCWVFGFRSQSLRSENMTQLINDQSKREGNRTVYKMCCFMKHRQVEVQFTLSDVNIPPSVTSFGQLAEYLKNPATTVNAKTVITIGRILKNHSLEYIGSFQKRPVKTIKYTEIRDLLEALSIQIDTKGKFIIQQSALLASVRQKNTGLLEIIEDSIGNTAAINALSDLQKKQSDLERQQEGLVSRREEIERYRHEKESEIELEKKRCELDAELNKFKEEMSQVSEEREMLRQKRKQVELQIHQEKEEQILNQINELKKKKKELEGMWERGEEERVKKEEEFKEVKNQWNVVIMCVMYHRFN